MIHLAVRFLLGLDLREIARDVWAMVRAWVADLVEQLLRDRADRDEPAGPLRLGHAEAAILAHLGNRVADPAPAALRDGFPVREEPAARLGVGEGEGEGEGDGQGEGEGENER